MRFLLSPEFWLLGKGRTEKLKPDPYNFKSLANGGEGGIRTPETREGLPVFKTGAINRSATSPVKKYPL